MTGHPDAAAVSGAPGEERDRALAHVAACAACRRRIADEDPSALFALLAARPVPREILDGVSRAVFAGAGRSASGGAAPGGRVSRFAAAAASLLLAAALGTFSLRHAPGPAAPLAVSAPARATVSVVPGATPAQVVDLTVGDTQVVMIFDPGASL